METFLIALGLLTVFAGFVWIGKRIGAAAMLAIMTGGM